MPCLGPMKKKAVKIVIFKRDYIEKITKKKKSIIQLATDVLPDELKKDTNFRNYMLKYGAYTFHFQSKHCNALHNNFLAGFKEEMRLYPEGHSNHSALVINGVDYLG